MDSQWNEIPADVRDMRRRTLFSVFSPSAPVDRREVFAGRLEQLATLREVVFQRGQHAVIYGERGVGKTSLARVSRDVATAEQMFTAHVTCDGGDSYASMWTKVLSEIHFTIEGTEGGEEGSSTALAYASEMSGAIDSNTLRMVFTALGRVAPTVVFIDEFDVITSAEVRQRTAETIKMLSDQGVNVTVVLVGVAEDVTGLISAHESINRNIVQVPMPRMIVSERLDIIRTGLSTAEMSIDDSAAQRIALLSQGLPHFVHSLAQKAALAALNAGRDRVEDGDVSVAISQALDASLVTVSSAYYHAVTSNRETTLYPSVLLACALATPDDRGFFTAKALVAPLTTILGREVGIPAFGPHLNKLANERGPVLIKEGEPRRYRYRFRNPLLQPYVLMRGISDGLISFSAIEGP
ncbi:ATP-binding protein [Pseudokineococcus lusitanus]|uniref:AAA domain-containing protein n=1 Tax=Pseudokineococcus lusitanus TaxID=763993 RepID=A0A3N1HTW1_9ACTN|nr:AAA family ATPase [Pseudokineococcus lusitanus]ROP45968.1 AAA domain-containing protein [Pseudokineococcus lusitanus]